MADSRFFSRPTPLSIAEIAALTGATIERANDHNITMQDVAPLHAASSEQVSFLDNMKYVEEFKKSAAGACFVRANMASHAPKTMALFITETPYSAYAMLATKLYPASAPEATIHDGAQIDETAAIGQHVHIAAGVVIGKRAKIGNHVSIGANTIIGDGVVIDSHTHIGPLCTITHALIGKHCIIHRGAQIGQDGFGFAPSKTGLLKVPQLGRVIIEDHVEIGANSCIDRGAGPDTIIGYGTKIDNLVQIAHNVQIGKHCAIAAQCGIAGSAVVEDGVMMGGQVGIAGHIRVGKGARLAAQSGIIANVPAGASYGGYPAIAVNDWHRQTITLSKLIKKQPN